MPRPASDLAAPLAPYLVLDLTDERGLSAGHLLAQLGAGVIQLEPVGGSSARGAGPFREVLPGERESLLWLAYAAGKRGISLDLERAEGRAMFLELVRQVDLLIESEAPRTMASRGLAYEELHRINPRLVHVSITAFGSTGPKARYAATDLIVWAASGAVWPHRGQDGVPLSISVPQAFQQAAIDAAGAALIALLARSERGIGQHIDVSAQASCTVCTLSSHLALAVNHQDFNPLGGVQSSKLLDLSGSGARTRKTKWQVRDGLVEMHIGMGTAAGRNSNALFAWLNDLGGCPAELATLDWVQVPRLLESGEVTGDDLNRARHYVAGVLERFTKAEILAVAQERGLLMAPVMTTGDLLASPQLASRGFFRPVGEDGSALPFPFATGCDTGELVLRPAPRIGEHNAEVYGELLGLADAALRDLAMRGVI